MKNQTSLYVEIEAHVRDTQYRNWGEKDDLSVSKTVKIEVPFENAFVLFDAIDKAAMGIAKAALVQFLNASNQPEVKEDENSSNG